MYHTSGRPSAGIGKVTSRSLTHSGRNFHQNYFRLCHGPGKLPWHIIMARHPLSLLSMLFRQQLGIECSLATVAALQTIIRLNQPVALPSYGARERVGSCGWRVGAGGSLTGLKTSRNTKRHLPYEYNYVVARAAQSHGNAC